MLFKRGANVTNLYRVTKLGPKGHRTPNAQNKIKLHLNAVKLARHRTTGSMKTTCISVMLCFLQAENVVNLFKLGKYVYRIPNDVQAIQMEILENGPVQANLRIYEDFLKYKSGNFDIHSKLISIIASRVALQVSIGTSKGKGWSITPSNY